MIFLHKTGEKVIVSRWVSPLMGNSMNGREKLHLQLEKFGIYTNLPYNHLRRKKLCANLSPHEP